jgi:hypothetical protein
MTVNSNVKLLCRKEFGVGGWGGGPVLEAQTKRILERLPKQAILLLIVARSCSSQEVECLEQFGRTSNHFVLFC